MVKPIFKFTNSEILAAVKTTLDQKDLRENMRNSRKILMSKAEFEEYLDGKPDRVRTLKRVTSFVPGPLSKYSINELNGICVVLIRTPASVLAKLPYKRYHGGNRGKWKIGVKTLHFKKRLKTGTTASSDADYDY